MKKSMVRLALASTATSLFLIGIPLFASETDDRIELYAKRTTSSRPISREMTLKSSTAEKDLTTKSAKDPEGVKDVKNEMTVPVPTSLLLLGTGLVGLAGLRGRRTKE